MFFCKSIFFLCPKNTFHFIFLADVSIVLTFSFASTKTQLNIKNLRAGGLSFIIAAYTSFLSSQPKFSVLGNNGFDWDSNFAEIMAVLNFELKSWCCWWKIFRLCFFFFRVKVQSSFFDVSNALRQSFAIQIQNKVRQSFPYDIVDIVSKLTKCLWDPLAR